MKSIGLIKVSFGIVIAVMLPTILEADTIASPPSPKVAVMLLANKISYETGVDAAMIKNVLKHESGFNQDAIGDHGKAHNVAQYHEDEFNGYNKKYQAQFGLSLNYNSAEDQIRLMTYQFKYYPRSRRDWSTYRKLYGKVG